MEPTYSRQQDGKSALTKWQSEVASFAIIEELVKLFWQLKVYRKKLTESHGYRRLFSKEERQFKMTQTFDTLIMNGEQVQNFLHKVTDLLLLQSLVFFERPT